MVITAPATNKLQTLQAQLQGDNDVAKMAKIRRNITKLHHQLVVNQKELAKLQRRRNITKLHHQLVVNQKEVTKLQRGGHQGGKEGTTGTVLVMVSTAPATNKLQTLQAQLQGDNDVAKMAKIRQNITKVHHQLVVNQKNSLNCNVEDTRVVKDTLKT